MLGYESESSALDGEVLDDADFNDLALRLFAHQLRYNEPYARYCARLGLVSSPNWEDIPAVPAAAFKEAALTTFDPHAAARTFETSGTTSGVGGLHYLETPALYDAALLAGFDRLVLRDARLRYFNLVPNPAERPASSLGYMMARISGERGAGRTGWYLHGDELLADAFEHDLRAAIADRELVCIAAMTVRGVAFELPVGSCIMTTGGFKGRSRIVQPSELETRICTRFGISRGEIVSEYGMTELSSQYYRAGTSEAYVAPPWLRTRVVGPERATLPRGTIGALLHVDLANRSSCIAVQTEDLGMETAEGLVLFGRDREASLRGCSLDAETLATRAVS